MTALTNVVRDMLDGRENDEQITVEVSLLWSLVYEAEARAALLAELEAGVEGLMHPESQSYDRMTRDGALRAVLDLIRNAHP